MLEASVLKLEEETVQAEETAVASFSLSCLEQVKEWLERDQEHLGQGASRKGTGQTFKTLKDHFCYRRAGAKRSWPLPLYRS